MKDKFVRALAFAVVSMISAALIAWLNNPENRVRLQKYARKTKNKVEYVMTGE